MKALQNIKPITHSSIGVVWIVLALAVGKTVGWFALTWSQVFMPLWVVAAVSIVLLLLWMGWLGFIAIGEAWIDSIENKKRP